MNTFKYCKVRSVKSPTRGTTVAAGVDFFVPDDIDVATWEEKCSTANCHPTTQFQNGKLATITLKPGESVMIPSGIKMKLPTGYAMVMMNKSGIGAKRHLDTLACVIDEDYEGEVHLNLVNAGSNIEQVAAGDKIVQGVILPVNYAIPECVDEADLFAGSTSARGTGGFGSTGTI